MSASTKQTAIALFAANLGKHAKVSLATSAPYAKAYAAADKTEQHQIRVEFRVSYVMGYMACDDVQATTWLAMTRNERNSLDKDIERACNAASKALSFHILRNDCKAPAVRANTDVPKAALAKGKAYLAQFKTVAEARAALNAAIASLK